MQCSPQVDNIEANCPQKWDDDLGSNTFKWTIREDIKDNIKKAVSQEVANLRNAPKMQRCLKSYRSSPTKPKKKKRARSSASNASEESSSSAASKESQSDAPSPRTTKAAEKQEAMRCKLVAKAAAAEEKKNKAEEAKAAREKAQAARKAARCATMAARKADARKTKEEEKCAKKKQLEECVSSPPS
jgi:colicin import membrane protein